MLLIMMDSRFGVGAKDAIFRLGTVTNVESKPANSELVYSCRQTQV